MYKELIDLRAGSAPAGLQHVWRGPRRCESVSPTATRSPLSGLGGDPFPTAQFTVSKRKLFDLRVNWRQAYYYWNQNDNVILPIATVAPGPVYRPDRQPQLGHGPQVRLG